MDSSILYQNSNQNLNNKNIKNENETNNLELNSDINYIPSVGDIIECVTKICTYNGEVLLYNKNDNFITIWDGSDKNSKIHIINIKFIIFVCYFK